MHPHDLDPSMALPPDDLEVRQLRLPPHSIQCECGVLGGLLLDSSNWEHVGDLLAESDFYRAEHRLVFAAIAALAGASKPADVLTVHAELQRRGKADDAGGLSYLNSLAQYVPSASNMRRYAEIVRERAVLRELIAANDASSTLAFNPQGADASQILDRSMGRLQTLQLRGVRSKPVLVQDLVVPFLDRFQALSDGTVKPGIPTRIPTLDRMLGGGIKPGKQIIVAARPSIGKSSFAQQICLNLARDGHACAFLSQEMGNAELTDRAVANLGSVDLERLSTGSKDGDDAARVAKSVEAMRNLPLLFDDQPALTLADISAKARLLKRQHGVKLIVLDYLQLCASGKTDDSRHHQLEEISRGIKNLAKQLDLSFISLSQLNREVEKRASGRPVLSDLKESGSIEEDADAVLLLSRHQGNPQQIVCDVPKNRQGRVGEFRLIFNGQYQQWMESAEPFLHTPVASQSHKRYTNDFGEQS